MYSAMLEDGTWITGDKVQWQDLPADVRIKEMSTQLVVQQGEVQTVVVDDHYQGFDAYGFQIYKLQAVGTHELLDTGVQIICVDEHADSFLTVDISLKTRRRLSTWKPLAQMTYNKALLRRGISL